MTLPPNGTQRASEPTGAHRFQHRDEVAGDRHLAHRAAQLAALDQPAGGAHREGAGHRVDARVEARHVRHVEPVARARRPGRRGPPSPGSTTRLVVPDRRRRAVGAAAGVAGASASRLAGGARVVTGSASSRPSSISGVAARAATPSPSKGALAGPSRSVPSSASAQRGVGHLLALACRRTASGRAGRRRRTASSR